MTTTALIVAAGSGHRLGGAVPKQFRKLGGIPVLRRAVMPFANHPRIDQVRIVVAEDSIEDAHRAVGGGLGDVQPIIGGATRGESVRRGLAAIDGEIVLIHDAARPFCPPAVIDRLLDALAQHPAAVPALPVNDTLAKRTELLGEHIDREGAVRVQTPQAFTLSDIRAAYSAWHGAYPSDDSFVARAAGLDVAVVAGAAELDKLTTSDDWNRMETMVANRIVGRTGMGFDVHAFAGKGPIMIGGIEVQSERGLSGHSDADVVLHAVTDALLGAASLGDIGEHFPPSDPKWRGAASDLFVTHALALVLERGGIIDHVDVTVICEMPKIGPHKAAMRSRIANLLNVDECQISIKATTTDGLGFAGRGEGIAAQAVASIRMEANHG